MNKYIIHFTWIQLLIDFVYLSYELWTFNSLLAGRTMPPTIVLTPPIEGNTPSPSPNDISHWQCDMCTHQALLQHALDILQVIKSITEGLSRGREGAVLPQLERCNWNDFNGERRYVEFIVGHMIVRRVPCWLMVDLVAWLQIRVHLAGMTTWQRS